MFASRNQQPVSPWNPAGSKGITPLLILLVTAFVSFRKLNTVLGTPGFLPAVVLLGAFTLLYLLQFAQPARFGRYLSLYFLMQMLIVQSLGLLQPYEDTWGLLYVILGMQLRQLPSWQAIKAWAAVFSAVLLVTMIATQDLLPGLGFGVLYIAVTIFFFSYDLAYAQAETAKQESRVLLEELQTAHQRLKDYAAQAEELAAAQERDRLIRELHDSVSQMIFSISLTTESTRFLLSKDPSRLAAALERLQDLTASALAQMRTLISQWRPSER